MPTEDMGTTRRVLREIAAEIEALKQLAADGLPRQSRNGAAERMKSLKARLEGLVKSAADEQLGHACQDIVARLPHARRFGEWSEKLYDASTEAGWWLGQLDKLE